MYYGSDSEDEYRTGGRGGISDDDDDDYDYNNEGQFPKHARTLVPSSSSDSSSSSSPPLSPMYFHDFLGGLVPQIDPRNDTVKEQILFYFNFELPVVVHNNNKIEKELQLCDFWRHGTDHINRFLENQFRTFEFVDYDLDKMIFTPRRGIQISFDVFFAKISSSLDAPPNILMLDARFPEEFEYSHIDGARNIYEYWDNNQVLDQLWDLSTTTLSLAGDNDGLFLNQQGENTRIKRYQGSALIIYCDFSLYRAVELYHTIVRANALVGETQAYTELYILQGGYHRVVQECIARDTPEFTANFISTSRQDFSFSKETPLSEIMYFEIGQNPRWNNQKEEYRRRQQGQQGQHTPVRRLREN